MGKLRANDKSAFSIHRGGRTHGFGAVLLFIPLLELLFLGRASAFDPKNVLQNDFLQTEKMLDYYAQVRPLKSVKGLKEYELSQRILKDPDKKIKPFFKITPYFLSNVTFWFSIYSQFPSYQVVLHDRTRLNLVYDIIDFLELKSSPLNPYLKAQLQTQFAKEKVVALKETFHLLAKDPNTKNPNAQKVLQIIHEQGMAVPVKDPQRKNFFIDLSDNIRVQTGQQDMIFQGIINALPFLDYIYSLCRIFHLPEELLSISFLESSFNTRAMSRVGAAGIFQFMEFTGKRFLPMEKGLTDGRLSPLIATIGALHLLKENFMILKRWDLAVTAYNSGTKHIQLAQKKLGRKNISLEEIFRKYVHPHLGFASKNFYSEFLALVYVLAYKEQLFPYKGMDLKGENHGQKRLPSNTSKGTNEDYKVYLSLCDFVPANLFKSMAATTPQLKIINRHILAPQLKHKRGTVILAQNDLPSKQFYLLTSKQIRHTFPRNWKTLIKDVKGYSCSTK